MRPEHQCFLTSEMVHIRYRLDSQGDTRFVAYNPDAPHLGIALEHQVYEEAFYRNGLKSSSGVVSSDKILNQEQRNAIRDGLHKWHSGVNKFQVLMLEAGFKFSEAAMSHHDAEFIKRRKSTGKT